MGLAIVLSREALVCIGLVIAAPSFAAPPINVFPDPELQAWFKALKQPVTKNPCCAISDCRFIAFAIHDGHYEVELDGWRYVVPTETVIDGIASPTGAAVVCYTFKDFGLPLPAGILRDRPQDTIEILCFVPPRPQS